MIVVNSNKSLIVDVQAGLRDRERWQLMTLTESEMNKIVISALSMFSLIFTASRLKII
jgi:hypothetical protein